MTGVSPRQNDPKHLEWQAEISRYDTLPSLHSAMNNNNIIEMPYPSSYSSSYSHLTLPERSYSTTSSDPSSTDEESDCAFPLSIRESCDFSESEHWVWQVIPSMFSKKRQTIFFDGHGESKYQCNFLSLFKQSL